MINRFQFFLFTTPEYSYVLNNVFPVGYTFIMHHLFSQENSYLVELPLSIILQYYPLHSKLPSFRDFFWIETYRDM